MPSSLSRRCLATFGLFALLHAAPSPCHAGDEGLPPPTRRVLRPGHAEGPVGVTPAAVRAGPEAPRSEATRPEPTPPPVPAPPLARAPIVTPAHGVRPADDPLGPPGATLLPPPVLGGATGASPVGATPAPTALTRGTSAAVEVRATVRRLTSPDFLDRMRAARGLVEVGEGALPELGAAGSLTVAGPGGLPMSATRGVLEAIFESLDEDRVRAWLAARWPTLRRAAAAELGRRRAVAAVPDLIDRLADETPCVRAAAVASLRSCTRQWFGYDAESSAGARGQAIGRWRGWWTVTARAGAASDPGTLPTHRAR